MNKSFSILIVDDHKIIIDGYKNALNFGFSKYSNAKLNIDFVTSFKNAVENIKHSNKNRFYDLVVLDLSLPKCGITKMNTGEDLGKWIKLISPKTKIFVITGFDNAQRMNSVLRMLNPEGIAVKSEISAIDFVSGVINILENKTYYGSKIITLLNSQPEVNYKIDDIDIQILNEISNGTKNIDLPKYIPMSKSGIEKRKRQLKEYFQVQGVSNRELIIIAKQKGYI